MRAGDQVDAIVNTNLKGFFYSSQEAATHMAANKQGHIVTITASIAMQLNVKVPALLPILIKGALNKAPAAGDGHQARPRHARFPAVTCY